MTSEPFRATWRLGLARAALLALCMVLLQLLTACADLRPLGHATGAGGYGSWLELDENRMVEVSTGIRLELPDSPYRARFEDADGVYYQASQPLVFRTWHGAVNMVAGGLYVRHGDTGQARPWFYPTLGAPHTPNPRLVRVRLFTPA